jgi:hypothetical protein
VGNAGGELTGDETSLRFAVTESMITGASTEIGYELARCEFSVAEVVESILTDAGHEVATASNGQQELDGAKERRPALILLGLTMPIMGGPSMLKGTAGRVAAARCSRDHYKLVARKRRVAVSK